MGQVYRLLVSEERVGQVVLKVIGISGNEEDGEVWE